MSCLVVFRKLIVKVTALLLVMSAVLLLIAPSMSNSDDSSTVAAGTQIIPSLSISVTGGTNQYGKKTLFDGTSINFGGVSFIHPELIINGDAYLQGGDLMLEAVIGTDITFNGTNMIGLSLTRLIASANPFSETYYSLSLSRSDNPTIILQDPQSNRICELMTSGTVTIKMLFRIKAQQTGSLTDRFRLTATGL